MSNKIEGSGHVAALRLDRQIPVDRSGIHREGPVDATPKSDSLRLTDEAEHLYAIERSLRDSDGIDMERVVRIKTALAEGSYSINPDAIAVGMLALDRALFD
jgi:negative regulator of flagellin synthesis FlgM